MNFFLTFLYQNFHKFNVSNLAETFQTSAKYKIILVEKVSARLETSNFWKILFTFSNQIFQKFIVSNLAETFADKWKVSVRLETLNFWKIWSRIPDPPSYTSAEFVTTLTVHTAYSTKHDSFYSFDYLKKLQGTLYLK